VLRIFIALMMKAVRTSETSAHFNVIKRRYIPEDCKLRVLIYPVYMQIFVISLEQIEFQSNYNVGNIRNVSIPHIISEKNDVNKYMI
jgi:hypothetical protein